MILYLHGFRSSPQSFKAQLMEQAIEAKGQHARWVCPQQPVSPAETVALLDALIDEHAIKKNLDPETQLTVIGSSLGGYYASLVAEKWACKAVVLNPSVNPVETLKQHLGKHTRYHSNEPFEFLPEHLQELEALPLTGPKYPQRYYLLACTGDEVLDWRTMANWYQGSQGRIIEGGNHSISDFERYIPEILEFALPPLHPSDASLN